MHCPGTRPSKGVHTQEVNAPALQHAAAGAATGCHMCLLSVRVADTSCPAPCRCSATAASDLPRHRLPLGHRQPQRGPSSCPAAALVHQARNPSTSQTPLTWTRLHRLPLSHLWLPSRVSRLSHTVAHEQQTAVVLTWTCLAHLTAAPCEGEQGVLHGSIRRWLLPAPAADPLPCVSQRLENTAARVSQLHDKLTPAHCPTNQPVACSGQSHMPANHWV